MSHPLPFLLPSLLPGSPETALADSTLTGGDGAGSLRLLTSHHAAAVTRILAQYKESPKLLALLQTYLDQCQGLDVVIAEVYESLDLDTAEGTQLDLLGRIVREARDGRADYEYRRGLRVRILINRSQGRIPDLIAIVRLFEGMDDESGAFVAVSEVQPARIEVYVDGTSVNPPGEIDRRLRRAKAAGVALQTITFPAEGGGRTEAFRLTLVADYPEAPGVGLAMVDQSAGGDLAIVLA